MLKTLEELLKEENANLAPYAMKSHQSMGRVFPQKEDPFRTPFQRDRDRVIHCKAFRRLQAKTQVFVSYFGDHYRDRMTHSIEVAQIARDMSRTLGLNEDLSECLALAHDLGHPPFGHGGEQALDEVLQQFGLHFEHNEQSRRIVEKLENGYFSYPGLNLTKEVLDGLLKHHPHQYHTYLEFQVSAHLEGQIVDVADEIAYTSHDVDDGLRSGLITPSHLKKFQLWNSAFESVLEESQGKFAGEKDEGKKSFYRRVVAKMVRNMVWDLQQTVEKNLKNHGIDSVEKVRSCPVKLVNFSLPMQDELRKLKTFLMENFYLHEKVQSGIDHGKDVIKKLFSYYHGHIQELPEAFQELLKNGEKKEIVVKDYIAGMTDHYAEELARKNILHF